MESEIHFFGVIEGRVKKFFGWLEWWCTIYLDIRETISIEKKPRFCLSSTGFFSTFLTIFHARLERRLLGDKGNKEIGG